MHTTAIITLTALVAIGSLRLRVGTRSVLYGAHCFFLHPIFVAWAWVQLYGWTWDPRYWVAFVVHDWGYWRKPNMDGQEGEAHVFAGASIMGLLFDGAYLKPQFGDQPASVYSKEWDKPQWAFLLARFLNRRFGYIPEGRTWYNFAFYHSRFMAKRYGIPFSRLCVADKLAFCLEPAWLYVPRVLMSGEVHEYMDIAAHREGKYVGHEVELARGIVGWHRSVRAYLRGWVSEQVRASLAARGVISAEAPRTFGPFASIPEADAYAMGHIEAMRAMPWHAGQRGREIKSVFDL